MRVLTSEDGELDRINDRLDDIDLILTIAGEDGKTLPNEEALRTEMNELRHRRYLLQRQKFEVMCEARNLGF